MVFTKYPYSHSLILTNVISLATGIVLSLLLHNFLVIPVFVLGCASHWILDTIVHLKDLPILGFNGDSKVGLGLWNYGKIAFVVEYVFYALFVLLLVPASVIPGALFLGFAFHIVNINSFIGFTKKNPFDSSPRAYAAVTLIGFVLIPLFAGGII
jgi:hypothetical protein